MTGRAKSEAYVTAVDAALESLHDRVSIDEAYTEWNAARANVKLLEERIEGLTAKVPESIAGLKAEKEALKEVKVALEK